MLVPMLQSRWPIACLAATLIVLCGLSCQLAPVPAPPPPPQAVPGPPPGPETPPADGDTTQTDPWVLESFTGEHPCRSTASCLPWTVRSPYDDWEIHPAHDEHGGVCLVSPSRGIHQIAFRFIDNMTEQEWQGLCHNQGRPDRPDAAFWAGDGSGFYIWHAAGHFFYFYDLETDEAGRIDSPAFRHARDLSRMVTVLGSPMDTRDVILFEHHCGWETDSHRWRLTVVDPDGRERLCLAEFDDTFSWVEGVASHTAVLTRAGVQGIRELDRCGRLWQVIDDVRLFRLGADGQWTTASYTDCIQPALRVDRLTRVSFIDDVPWISEVTPDGSVNPMFILSEQALHMMTDPWPWWDSGGRCMFIMQSDSVIRYVGE